jgi:glycogen synthase
MSVEVLVLGRGSENFGTLFTKLAKEQSHRIHIVSESDAAMRKMYAASDMALFFSDPSGLPELRHALNYGVVPVAPACECLEDYDPVQEHGTAFIAESATPWMWFAALVRALETYKFPFDWKTIQRQCMESVA